MSLAILAETLLRAHSESVRRRPESPPTASAPLAGPTRLRQLPLSRCCPRTAGNGEPQPTAGRERSPPPQADDGAARVAHFIGLVEKVGCSEPQGDVRLQCHRKSRRNVV